MIMQIHVQIQYLYCILLLLSLMPHPLSDTPDAPPTKIKPPPTSSVIVEQTGGDTDKLLIDQVRDPDMIFEDVSYCN